MSTPTFASLALRARSVANQTDAELLAGAIRHCHAEARRHGLSRVTTDLRVRESRLIITVSNEIRPHTRPRSGSGRKVLADLVVQLPAGAVEQRAKVEGDDMAEGMWRTRFSCAESVLDP